MLLSLHLLEELYIFLYKKRLLKRQDMQYIRFVSKIMESVSKKNILTKYGIVFIELIKAGAPGKVLDLDFLWSALL